MKLYTGKAQPSPGAFCLKIIIAKSLAIVALISIAGAWAVFLPAQDAVAQAEIRFGAKTGLSRATVAGTDFADNRNGFVLGGFVRADFPLFVSAQLEGLFVQKGYALKFDQFIDLDGTILLGNVDADVQLNYVEIPVVLNFPLPVLEPISPELHFGVAVSFLTSEKITFNNTSPEDQERLFPGGDIFEKLDTGFVLGGGINREMGNQQIGLELRYTFGILDIAGDGVRGNNVQSQALMFMVVLGF